MQGYKDRFAGKKITVMGLGLLGRGVGDAAFLAECGAQVKVTDKKPETELAESVAQLKAYPNISFHLGGHDEKDFTNCDLVIKAAGVPLDSPEIAAAREAGVEVAMSTALFAQYAGEAGATIVGVTGTRGKSTTAHMIFHALQKAGKRAFLGGNIRGKSTLALLPEVEKGDVCVLELDSWQLQGFGDLEVSPHIAVFTTFYPDHLNYYGGDTSTSLSTGMEKYFADKANIFRYQKEGDILFVGKQVADRVPGVVPSPIPADWQLKIPGEHNRENAALAAAALHTLGLSDTEIKESLESFEGVEGRLQFVREIRGVRIYNDNNATTPEATLAALKSFDGSTILIMGGSDKGLDMSALVAQAKKCKKVILLAGTGTDAIRGEFADAPVCASLDEAVKMALDSAQKGDTILFSPAFASFGMFKNEYDRNDQFLRILNAL